LNLVVARLDVGLLQSATGLQRCDLLFLVCADVGKRQGVDGLDLEEATLVDAGSLLCACSFDALGQLRIGQVCTDASIKNTGASRGKICSVI
jgi:hypothetical protein